VDNNLPLLSKRRVVGRLGSSNRGTVRSGRGSSSHRGSGSGSGSRSDPEVGGSPLLAIGSVVDRLGSSDRGTVRSSRSGAVTGAAEAGATELLGLHFLP
jgi:hypothetical protein